MKLLPPTTDFSQALPLSWQGLINALCRHFQVDSALAVPAFLGMASSLVHDKFTVRIHDYVTNASFDEPLSLFCIGVASSSERKSPLLKWLKSPIQKEIEQLNVGREDERLQLDCERKIAVDEAKKLRKKLSSLPSDSPQRELKLSRLVELEKIIKQPQLEPLRLFLQDSTAIAAADFMQKQAGNALVIADAEGGSFDSILNDHRLLELLLSGFSNEGISFERSSRPSVDIASPHASLCILTQEVKLHKLANKSSTWDEGFVPRSLIFLAREMAGTRQTAIGEAIPQEILNWWQQKCHYYLNLEFKKDCFGNRDYYVLDLSPEAAQVWRQFSAQLEAMMQLGTPTYNLRAWLGKMSGVVVRIAGFFHLLDAKNPLNCTISALHMKLACNLIFAAQLHMAEVAKLYFTVDNSVDLAVHKIVNWLKQEHGSLMFFKMREMYRQLGLKANIAHQACGYLSNLGVLHLNYIPDAKVGRNCSPVYSVNYLNLNIHYPFAQY